MKTGGVALMSPSSSPLNPLNLFFYSTPSSPRFSSSPSPSYYHHHHQSFFSTDADGDLDHVSLLSHQQSLPAPSSSVPFDWELSPGVPKTAPSSPNLRTEAPTDDSSSSFEFDFSGQLDKMLRPSFSSADELFDGGKIRPLKPPPRLQNHNHNPFCSYSDSPISPKSPIISKFKDALSLSPRHKDDHLDPFEAALNNSSRDRDRGRARGGRHDDRNDNTNPIMGGVRRGNISSRRGISRSLSPLRVSEFALLHQQQQEQTQSSDDQKEALSSCSRGGSKKWRLKDLFLFRSASEGRASTSASGAKDPLRKLFSFSRRNSMEKETDEGNSSHHSKMLMSDSKNSSFRSTGSGSGGSVSKRRGGGQAKVSAHEMHYTAKRAVSKELKKKTSLPYKHGLLSCLGFNPVLHDLSHAFASLTPSS